MNKISCEKCGSEKIDLDIMRLVTGQVDGPASTIEVWTCMDCGHEWAGATENAS
jgi:DNA-directed RNA polymerase subunit M/transcription elongation factor TFIIS